VLYQGREMSVDKLNRLKGQILSKADWILKSDIGNFEFSLGFIKEQCERGESTMEQQSVSRIASTRPVTMS